MKPEAQTYYSPSSKPEDPDRWQGTTMTVVFSAGLLAACGILLYGAADKLGGNQTIPVQPTEHNTVNQNNVPHQIGVVFNPDGSPKPFGDMTVTVPSPTPEAR